mgnify:CR=1 FL=1
MPNEGFYDTIKQIQKDFHLRLFFLKQKIDAERIRIMEVKAKTAKNQWDKYIEKINSWRRECHQNTCKGCDRHRSRCCCHQDITLEELTFIIRRIARINPIRGNPETVLDENKHGGPVGYRVCGKDSWDNTVRAREENQ